MQSTLTPTALAWLRAHHGIITSAQLASCAVSRRFLATLADRAPGAAVESDPGAAGRADELTALFRRRVIEAGRRGRAS